MALPFVTAVRFYLLHLLIRLNALGDHDFVETRTKTGNRADDRLGIGFLVETLNERLVNLDLLEGKLAQIVKRGVAGAEIVQRNTHPEVLELLNGRQRSIVVFEQEALSDLQLQPLRGKPRLGQRRYHLQGEAAVAELHGRKRDGDLDTFRPCRCFEAGTQQGPFAQCDDQSGLFGNGDEDRGRHHSADRVLPAQRGLAGRHAAVAQIDQGLEVNFELVRGERFAQVEFKRATLLRRFLHLECEETMVAATSVLRGVSAISAFFKSWSASTPSIGAMAMPIEAPMSIGDHRYRRDP